jgi:alginate O-acetyltransferase complex protein AlgI
MKLTDFSYIFDYSLTSPWFFTHYGFIFVLGFFLLIYSFFDKASVVKRIYVILFSCFFYYKSSGPYVLLFIGMIFGDFIIALLIEKFSGYKKKLLLALSICISLTPLIFFKYLNFVKINFNDLFNTRFTIGNVLLPIGISFYTFQSISYILDVYHQKFKASHNFINYAFYMTFFPHLVAGPIVRAKDFIPQIDQPRDLDKELFSEGFYRLMTGLLKKLLIADYFGKYVDIVHMKPAGYSGLENLISMYAYSFQIYFDFSGYSDIAIGIALLLGYRLNENFDNPYQASNIAVFWHKWHISLSSWLRDYVYISMGGNKKGKFRTYLHLFLTMLIGGIWHGASWRFVVWGVAHGIALIIHRLFFGKEGRDKSERKENTWLTVLNVFVTFNFVSFLWIFFRAQSFTAAFDSIRQILFNFHLNEFRYFFHGRTKLVYMLLLGTVIIFTKPRYKNYVYSFFKKMPAFFVAITFFIVLEVILQLKFSTIQPFIYFNF